MGDMPQDLYVSRNGKAIERTILILGFLIQFGALVLGYGRLTEKVDDLSNRIERIERFIDQGGFAKR